RLHAHGALDVRIERAVDDQGRPLAVTAVRADIPQERDDWGRPVNGRSLPQPSLPRGVPIALRLPPPVQRFGGERPVERIRELAGSATIETFIGEPALHLARPAEAIGRTVLSGTDVALKVTSLSRAEHDELRLVAELQLPMGVLLD